MIRAATPRSRTQVAYGNGLQIRVSGVQSPPRPFDADPAKAGSASSCRGGIELASLAGFKSHRDLSPTPCLAAGRLRSAAVGLMAGTGLVGLCRVRAPRAPSCPLVPPRTPLYPVVPARTRQVPGTGSTNVSSCQRRRRSRLRELPLQERGDIRPRPELRDVGRGDGAVSVPVGVGVCGHVRRAAGRRATRHRDPRRRVQLGVSLRIRARFRFLRLPVHMQKPHESVIFRI